MTTSADTSRVKLDWSSNSESDLAGYLVYRSNAADGTFSKLTATPRTSSDFYDYAARAGFPSYYKVTAVDKAGNESTSVSVTNTRKDGTKPTAVKSLTAVRTDNGIKLDWADNPEADLAGYVITRATSSSGTYTKLTASPIKDSAFDDPTASASGTYYYKISAVDFSGYLSSSAKIAMLPPDVIAPRSVSGMTTTASTSYIKLDWSSNSESDLAGYNVYRATTVGGEYTKLTTSLRTSSDYTDSAAPSGVTSFYRVTAVDKSGNESTPVAASGVRKDGVAPAAVKSLSGTRTSNGITLDWADNTETDLVGYTLTRATSSGGTYTRLTTSPIRTSTFDDGTAAAGTAYYYKVTAVDVSGNSSSAASVAVLPPDVTAPQPVAGMTVSADTSRVKLDWTSNTESDLAGYLVYRASTADGTYTKLTTVPTTSSEYSDSAAPVGVTSFYRVTAVDKSGNESAAVAASGVRRDGVAPAAVKTLTAGAADTGVSLDWADNTEADLGGYVVSRATTSGGTYTKLTAKPIAASTFVDTTAPAGTVYYKVSAVDLGGNTSAATGVVFTPADITAPAAVTGLTTESGADRINLAWRAGTDADLASYNVYRWVDGAGSDTATKLNALPVTGPSYVDMTAEAATKYHYAVTAVDTADNESSRSGDVVGTLADTTAPGAPTGLTATGTTADVTLDWADQSEADLAGYRVYRSADAGGTFTKLADVPVTESTYTDGTAPAGTRSYYRVTAFDTAGNESAPAGADAARLIEKAPVVGADLTVAQDGSGDYTTVAAAVDAAPSNATAPFVIAIKPGTYRETLTVAKPNLTFTGATTNASDVVITYDNAAGTINPASTTGAVYGTSGSATVLIKANNVTTKNLTIENSYKETGTGNEQAVALKTSGDRLVFDNVRLLGDQDTLYADSPAVGSVARSYYTNSYVEGDVDFVFGRGTAVFDHSTLKAASRGSTSNNGYVTAASTDKSLTYGYLITDSTITSDAPAGTFSLGRPWQPSNDVNAIAQVVVRNTELPAAIKSTPWSDMGTSLWRNARFFEYQNTGAGAAVNADRPQLSDVEAAKYTKFTYLAGTDNWNPTGQTPPPPPADTTAPVVPSDLAATPGDSKVDLSWTANSESDLAGYNVYRSTSDTVAITTANKLNANPLSAASYTDRTAANGTHYAYVVTAVDKAGNESQAATPTTATPVGVPLPAHDLLVATDGTGQYTSVQAAVDAATAGTAAKPTVIAVKPGTYKEMLTVSKNYVTLIGTTGNAKDVVLTYDNASGTPLPSGVGTYGTGGSQSVWVKGNNVTVKDLTIENSFDEAAYTYSAEQAVALKTTGDRLVFDNVRLLGNQDTLLADSPSADTIARSYFVNSYIEGDVDFIFGRGTAVFSKSTINALSRGSNSNNGYVTAASTSDKNPNGFLIVDSTITSNAPAGTFSLGRPWRGWADGTQVKNGITYNSRGQVTIRNTSLPAAIRSTQPWTDMSPNLWTDGRFFEYGNTGDGATVNANRPQLSDEQAASATPAGYLSGTDGWNPIQ